MAVSHEQAESIRKQHEAGDTYAALAAEYGISKLSIKNIVKFKTHAVKGDQEMRPRHVSALVPADIYLKIEEFAEKQQVDVSTAALRLILFACKLHRSLKSSDEQTPHNT